MAGDTSLFETCQVGSGRSRRRRFGVDDRGQNQIAPVVKMETVEGLESTAFMGFFGFDYEIIRES